MSVTTGKHDQWANANSSIRLRHQEIIFSETAGGKRRIEVAAYADDEFAVIVDGYQALMFTKREEAISYAASYASESYREWVINQASAITDEVA